MSFNRSVRGLVTMGLFVSLALTSGAAFASPAGATKIDFQLVTHIQAGVPEQHVFVERNDILPDQVMRIEGNEATDPSNLSKMLYASATPSGSDPFKTKPDPLGPFPKGAALGFTLGQWLAATASGNYTVNGDSAELRLSAQKLVPNGVYTVWCSRITFPPNFGAMHMPCGAPDGSQAHLNVDAQGNAMYSVTMAPLPASTKETATVIALAYHSDDKTYGDKPGAFGQSSHVQLFYFMPEGMPAAAQPALLPETGGATNGVSGLWLAIVGAGLGAAGWLARKRIARAR